MIGKVLLSALEVCKPLPLMLLSRGTVISQRIFAKVIDGTPGFTPSSLAESSAFVCAEMNLAVSRKAGDWATIKPLRTYSVPSYKAFQTASPFAAKVEVSPSRAVSPPPFHVDVPLDARVIDETALDVWKSILVILCETLAAMCEPSADSAGTFHNCCRRFEILEVKRMNAYVQVLSGSFCQCLRPKMLSIAFSQARWKGCQELLMFW
jgi:hypothetical protein